MGGLEVGMNIMPMDVACKLLAPMWAPSPPSDVHLKSPPILFSLAKFAELRDVVGSLSALRAEVEGSVLLTASLETPDV